MALCMFLKAPTLYSLQFPRNGDAPTTAFVALQFANPQSDGLPVWGPSDAGVTIVRKIKPVAQTAASNGTYYYAQFWWSQNDGHVTFDNDHPYWGCHPYPPDNDVPAWVWEIACESADAVLNGNSETISLVNDVVYTQGIRVTHNGDGTKTIRFYMNLPSVAADDVITFTTGASYGESMPSANALTIGDSPWYGDYEHERAACTHGPIKVFAADLGESDMAAEATDFMQLKTAAGASAIWYGKKGFATVDDLTCDYGTERAFAWADANNKATLVTAL